MFVYESPIGLMCILFEVSLNGFKLVINNTWYGTYPSAVAAADDVFTHSTGCIEWDIDYLDYLDTPTDIHEWVRVS